MTLDDWLDATDVGCFKFLETAINLNWLEAQQKCEEIGGYLAEPRTRRYKLNLFCTRNQRQLVYHITESTKKRKIFDLQRNNMSIVVIRTLRPGLMQGPIQIFAIEHVFGLGLNITLIITLNKRTVTKPTMKYGLTFYK